MSSYPPEVEALKTFDAGHNSPYLNPYDESLSKEVDTIPCRRCGGCGFDPDTPTFCMTCGGSGEEHGTFRVCSTHSDRELVRVGKRRVEWEDSQGFDHKGYLEVKGCPVCQKPAYSETAMA